jgi:hypothetical protein
MTRCEPSCPVIGKALETICWSRKGRNLESTMQCQMWDEMQNNENQLQCSDIQTNFE